MAEEQVFVSHAPSDLDLVQELFSTVRNLHVDVHVVLEGIEPGRSRQDLEGRLANSDLLVVVLTDEGATNRWVNQEIGYAVAKGIPILPLYTDGVEPEGYLQRHEGVGLDPDEMDVTVFNLLSRLRSELAPLGTLSTPNWFVRFPCNFENCGAPVTLDIQETQKKLWQMYEHNQALVTACGECDAGYFFNPATLGYVRREDPS
jgi:hypothetical protein